MRWENMIPCKSNEAVVTVLSYRNGIMDGYLQHPQLEREEKIDSLSQMILLLGSLLDLEGSFSKPLPLVSSACSKQDNIGVFRIQVFFWEHHMCKGRLFWQNGDREKVFRSTIELMQLLDEILARE